ncbi:MAG: flippase-like domain-containing protein [Phycisphaerae bacterium]|jgi:hypothetical protein|nr:flippase-like domain-containing protein [Phycisphaerae bacterium]
MDRHDEKGDRLVRLRELFGRVRPFGAAVGALLVVAAIALVISRASTLGDAWKAMGSASPLVITAMVAAMAGSVALTGLTFWILTRRYGRVSHWEMQALMSATAVANYLPLRPGLVARVVYHSSRNGIRARDSLRTIVEAMALSVIALSLLVPSLMVAHQWAMPIGIAVALPALLAIPTLASARSRPLGTAFLVRFGETLLTTIRYDLAFRLVGAPLPWHVAAAIACVSMVSTMVPFVSNGLGLREWTIGLMAPLLADVSLERGLVAELVHRAIEVVVIVPAGLWGSAWLWRRMKRDLNST